jgi:prepilin-type N-terminal cleavage/methylation domain-containing protein
MLRRTTDDRTDLLAIWLRVFLGVVFLTAAVIKSFTVAHVALVIEHLFPIGLPLAGFVALCVVLAEAFLGGLLIAGVKERVTIFVSLVTLVVLSLTLIYLRISPSPLSCGCFGLVKSSMGPREEATVGLIRNGALLIVNGWLVVRHGLPFGSSFLKSRERSRGAPAGFTLIEMLVVIVIVSVIIAISIPVLGRARNQARVSASLATLQQLAVAIEMYTTSSKESFPYVGTPGNPLGPIVVNGYDIKTGPLGGLSYFRANARLWISLLYPSHLTNRQSVTNESTRGSDASSEYPDGVFSSDLLLAHGCSAAPRYWDGDDAPIDDTLIRGSTLADVRFPAQKGLTWDTSSGKYLNKEGSSATALSTAGRADGSAGLIDMANPAGDAPVNRPYGAFVFPIMSTRYGLAGRDF